MKHRLVLPLSLITLTALGAFVLPAAVTGTAQSAAAATPPTPQAQARLAQLLDQDHDRFVDEIIKLTEIPAPPFKEAARGKAFARMLSDAGLTDVQTDDEGNVMGLYRGRNPAGGKVLAVAAHLDTVFPADVPIKVRREGTRLFAPGIGDNSRSLAALLAFVRAMRAAGIAPARDILFIGNVGEEGEGNLRGMRYLFGKGPWKGRIAEFISVDGTGESRIVNGGVASRRFKVTFNGPGGHSYGAFGLVNPMAAMSQAVVDLYRINPPLIPKTTYSASVTGGGTSVNSIPHSVFMEFDMRSQSPAELARLESRFNAIIAQAVANENAARRTSSGKISAQFLLIGDRPGGATPPTAPLVAQSSAIVKARGGNPELVYSSTDSNIPISMGIPAITISSGGTGGRAHALDEFIDVERGSSLSGLNTSLAIILAAAER